MDDETEKLITGLKNVSIQRCPDGPFSAPLAKNFPELAGFGDESKENMFNHAVGTRSVSGRLLARLCASHKNPYSERIFPDPAALSRFRDERNLFLSSTPDLQESPLVRYAGEGREEFGASSSDAAMTPPFRSNVLQPPPIGCERKAMMSNRQENTENAASWNTPRPLPEIHVQNPTPHHSAFPNTTTNSFLPMPPGITQNKYEDSPAMAAYRRSHGFSENYHGNLFVERNKSAPISDQENCSLFITGLPVTITVRELLQKIANHGRVYALHINSPDLKNGHRHCAAKVVFFEALAAQKFLAHCNQSGLDLNNHLVRAVHNRVRCAENHASHVASRALLIYGPADIVNPYNLTKFFSELFVFEVDCIISHGAARHTPEKALVEYRFGSFRCQSQLAKKALRSKYAGIVNVFYGEDPCSLLPTKIPNEHFLWTLFWCSQMQARAFLADVAEQQTSAATLASQARRTGVPQNWLWDSHPIVLLE